MAAIEKPLLYIGVGFLGALFLMSHFTILRPATAKSLSLASDPGFFIPGIDERRGGYIGERPS